MTTQLGILKSPGRQREVDTRRAIIRSALKRLTPTPFMMSFMSKKPKGKGKGGKPC